MTRLQRLVDLLYSQREPLADCPLCGGLKRDVLSVVMAAFEHRFGGECDCSEYPDLPCQKCQERASKLDSALNALAEKLEGK